MKRVIGLDASTSVIGIGIIDYDGYNTILVHCEYYKPDKTNGILEMLRQARDYILSIAIKYNIDEFVIEDYIRFMKGSSSAATTIPLAILNMTLRLAILDNLNINPECLNVLKIRHTLKLSKQLPAKEDMPDLVAHHLNIDYPWLYKINKRTKQQVIMEESRDVADAISVALAYIKLQQKPPKKSKPVKIKSKTNVKSSGKK
jgi:Holliday junction resolvasome RuvABC endonuclease subunit